jgi:hypothetical protein
LSKQSEIMAAGAARMAGYAAAGDSRAEHSPEIAHAMDYTTGDPNEAQAFCISLCCLADGLCWLDSEGIAYTSDNCVAVLNNNRASIEADLYPVTASVSDLVAKLGSRFTSAAAVGADTSIPVGSLVMYTWAPGENHCEKVLVDNGDSFSTVGGNVGGGLIAERTRNWQFIIGFLLPVCLLLCLTLSAWGQITPGLPPGYVPGHHQVQQLRPAKFWVRHEAKHRAAVVPTRAFRDEERKAQANRGRPRG